MKRALFALGVLFLSGPLYAGARTEAYAWNCGFKVADLASTQHALARNPYSREANPLPGMQSVGGRVGWGVGACAVASEADYRLRNHKKSKWALRVLVAGMWGYATVNNMRVAEARARRLTKEAK